MDFSITTLFVLPVSNTVPTTGTTANLTANQFGVFKPDYTPATAGNVASQPYMFLAQGRPVNLPGVGSKKSDKIYTKNVLSWYKVTAFSTAANQIVDVSDFNVQCGEDVTITLRLKSFYIDQAYYNGMTKSFTLKTPCCECGEDPCTELDPQATVDAFVALINGSTIGVNNQHNVANYVTASRVSSGTNSVLRIEGDPIAAENLSADPLNFQFQYDALRFWVYAYKGPATSQDFLTPLDNCDPFATVTTVQDFSYRRGTSAQAKLLEMRYNSYNTAPIAKRIFSNINFNGAFTSQVVDGTYYDFYYLKYRREVNDSHNATVPQDEASMILNPTGQNAGTIAILTAFLGTPVDETGATSSTTTTTTT